MYILGYSVSKQEVDKMMAEVDKDGSGKIEFAEFCELVGNKKSMAIVMIMVMVLIVFTFRVGVVKFVTRLYGYRY